MYSDRPRRWWNFSLWQLFAVMTVFCIYFAYQMHVVRGRELLLRQLREKHYFLYVTTAADYQANGGTQPVASVPIVRRWLGDQAVQSIGYYVDTLQPAEVRTLARSFPEAKVSSLERPNEPCHPGCFPRGTPIETAVGPRPIETIIAGDEVLSISDSGERRYLVVTSIFRTQNLLYEVETDRGTLLTTETQPLYTQLAAVTETGKLQVGDKLLHWSVIDNQLQVANVQRVRNTATIVPVINLVLGNRESFVAGGFLVRSKPPRDEIHQHQP